MLVTPLLPHKFPLLSIQLLIRQIHLRQPPPHHLGVRAHNAAVASYLALFVLDVCGRALAGDGVFIAEDEDGLVFAEEAVDVFEFAVGGFGVESVRRGGLVGVVFYQEGERRRGKWVGSGSHDVQIDDWDKGGVEDSPDDVEFPLQRLNADGSNLDDHD